MTAILKNFVTVRSTRGDVLSPTEYRTIVEAIIGIINKYDFKGLTKNYKALLAHLANYHDPHHDFNVSFLEEIVKRTYAIYVNMLPNPLSLADFKTQIVPTLSFVELFRRIVLNKYLYDQVKTDTGSVPTTANAYLSDDWSPGVSGGVVSLTFPNAITNETDFIRCGWNTNTAPIKVIFDALDLSVQNNNLPVVFEAISESQFWAENEFGLGYPIILDLASNDITIVMRVTGTPLIDTTLLSLFNGTDVIKLVMTTANIAVLLFNEVVLAQSSEPSTDGRIRLVLSRFGYAILETVHLGQSSKKMTPFVFTHDVPITNGVIGVKYENIFYPSFGLQSLIIYQGYTDPIPEFKFVIPNGYVLLTDPSGAYLCDSDGKALVDIAPNFFDDFNVLVDADGQYLTDPDGFYLVDKS